MDEQYWLSTLITPPHCIKYLFDLSLYDYNQFITCFSNKLCFVWILFIFVECVRSPERSYWLRFKPFLSILSSSAKMYVTRISSYQISHCIVFWKFYYCLWFLRWSTGQLYNKKPLSLQATRKRLRAINDSRAQKRKVELSSFSRFHNDFKSSIS